LHQNWDGGGSVKDYSGEKEGLEERQRGTEVRKWDREGNGALTVRGDQILCIRRENYVFIFVCLLDCEQDF